VGAETQNALVSLFRGTDFDEFGDVTDLPLPYIQHVPATWIETAQIIQDPATQTPRVVRTLVVTVPLWLAVRESDRLENEITGDVCMIEDVVKIPNLTGAVPDLKLVLKRVTR
jgi:hypothetical protein